MGSHKKPYHPSFPSSSKQPRLANNPQDRTLRVQSPGSTDHQTIAWQLHRVDHGGQWGWDLCHHQTFTDMILAKIKAFDQMTWHALASTGSHQVSLSDLCKEAQQRLSEIRQDDIDSLYSLRIRGKERIWGIREGRVLKILWWDPDHSVCPSQKRNT